jgi:hypothetical protein
MSNVAHCLVGCVLALVGPNEMQCVNHKSRSAQSDGQQVEAVRSREGN